MFHKAINLEFKEGTTLEVTFQNGDVKRYDISTLFNKYPQLRALEDRDLFLSGKLVGMRGIIWNDDLDIETETIYEDGVTVREERPAANQAAAQEEAETNATQKSRCYHFFFGMKRTSMSFFSVKNEAYLSNVYNEIV